MAKSSQSGAHGRRPEVRELKSLAKKKTAAAKIAKKLKGTEGATRQKAFSIGLSRSIQNSVPDLISATKLLED